MENIDEKDMESTETSSGTDSKAVGILSYIGLLWIVAYILYGKNKTEYNTFHIRQGLGLFILAIGNMIISKLPVIGFISLFIYIAIFIFAIMGILGAAKGEQKELPLIGAFINDNLKNFK
jgi:uncharacterized membrane protein